MKTTYTIPTTDIIITAHNAREDKLARILLIDIEETAEAAIEGYKYAIEACKCIGYHIDNMWGHAGAMYHLGMLKEPLSSIEYGEICNARRLELLGGECND